VDQERREFDRKWREDMQKDLKENTRLTVEIQRVLAVHCEGELAIKKELSEVRTAVYGNGVAGLKSDNVENKKDLADINLTLYGEDSESGITKQVKDMAVSLSWVWKILLFAWSFIVGLATLAIGQWEAIQHWMRGGKA